MQPFIFLIGPRGSGKTTVGGLLATQLHFAFLDTDDLIVKHVGTGIADIVASGGWDAFRAYEKEALRSLSRHYGGGGVVVATGGGIVVAPENRAALRQLGLVFFLSAPVDALCERLLRPGGNHERPPLTVDMTALGHIEPHERMHAEVRRVSIERDAFYRETAHHVIDATRPAEEIAEELEQYILHQGYL